MTAVLDAPIGWLTAGDPGPFPLLDEPATQDWCVCGLDAAFPMDAAVSVDAAFAMNDAIPFDDATPAAGAAAGVGMPSGRRRA